MSERGLGDRWIAGEALEGVAFAQHDAVRLEHDGAEHGGRVLLLMSGSPDPLYLVAVDGQERPVRRRQSELRKE